MRVKCISNQGIEKTMIPTANGSSTLVEPGQLVDIDDSYALIIFNLCPKCFEVVSEKKMVPRKPLNRLEPTPENK